jgi:hypothetical protein
VSVHPRGFFLQPFFVVALQFIAWALSHHLGLTLSSARRTDNRLKMAADKLAAGQRVEAANQPSLFWAGAICLLTTR